MKKESVRNFLSKLKTVVSKKRFFFKVDLNNINKFLVNFLSKEGFLRGFFLFQTGKGKKIYVILKFNDKEKFSISLIKRKNILSNRSQFDKQKNLLTFCNGFGLVLIYSIKGFIKNELAFWLKLGGKKIFEMV